MNRTSLSVLLISLSINLSAISGTVYIEDPDSTYRLATIEVKAERKPLATVQTLDGAKLQSLSSTSVADALKYFAGAQIKDYGGLGGLKTINVRSLGSQHVGIYIDGIRVMNAQNGTVDLGKFSLSSLESVSLYNAHKSDLVQSASEYASGATVYLNTRRPTTDSLSVLAGIGPFHTYRARINGQLCRSGWSAFVDAEWISSRGDYPFRYKSQYEDTVGRRKNSDIEYYRVEGAVFKNGFSSHVYCYVSERGCPGGIVRRLSDKYTNIGREWDTDIFVQASWQHRFGSRHNVKFNAKYSHEYLRYNTDFPDNQNTARVDNRYRTDDAYLSAAYSFTPYRGIWLNASYDARLSWMDADLKFFKPVRRSDRKLVGAFQAEWRGWRVAASALWQRYEDRTAFRTGAAEPIGKVTPSVTIGYHTGNFSTRVWYKRIFRMPTLNELYYTQAGNRNLKPEYTRQWNIGIEYRLTRPLWSVSMQGDAYINRIENRIVCLPLRGTYTWSMMNYGETYCRGLNATLTSSITPGKWLFSILATFTLQHDVNRTDPDDEETYDLPVCYSPRWSGAMTAVAAFGRYSLSVSYLHVAERIWSYADPEDVLEPYNNVDMRLTGGWHGFTASLEINDLFDVQYEHIPRYPMPGRNYRFSISYSF